MPLEFWFEFASTYSYLAAMRIASVCEAARVTLVWRPFLLGPIFADQGWSDSPFNLYPAKGRYMWRDMERLCEAQGLPFQRPSRFPRNGLLAARVAHFARDEPWLPDFVRAVYTANFGHDREIGDEGVVKDVVFASGGDPDTVLAGALAADNKRALREQTERAASRGLFGAPSFTVGDELFWGNERIGDAVVCARTGDASQGGAQ